MSLPPSADDSSGVCSATADVVAAFLALAVVVALPLSVANDLLGSPLSTRVVQLLVAVVGVGGAYPFVAGDWPLAKLTDFALVVVLAAFGLSAAFGVGLLVSGGGGLPSDSLTTTAVPVVVVGASFAVAAGYVRRRERRHAAPSAAPGET